MTLEDSAGLVSRRDAACRSSPRLGTKRSAFANPHKVLVHGSAQGYGDTTTRGGKTSSYDRRSGYCLAVASVRHGLGVSLMHDRVWPRRQGSPCSFVVSAQTLQRQCPFPPGSVSCTPHSSMAHGRLYAHQGVCRFRIRFSPGVSVTSCLILVGPVFLEEPGSLTFPCFPSAFIWFYSWIAQLTQLSYASVSCGHARSRQQSARARLDAGGDRSSDLSQCHDASWIATTPSCMFVRFNTEASVCVSWMHQHESTRY